MSEYIIKDENIEGTYESGGKEHKWFDEEQALAILLAQEVCFVSGQDYIAPWDNKKSTCGVVVNCNDVFYWATADAESLPNNEIQHLYRLWKENSKFGPDKWCCLRRHLRPQVPLVKMMKDENYWDADLEALPAPEPS